MNSRVGGLFLAGCLLAVSAAPRAQTAAGNVTLEVPLNLTRLSTSIVGVLIRCDLSSPAITATDPRTGQESHIMSQETQVPVSGGQVVATARVVFPVGSLVDPAGKTASYRCVLWGVNRDTARSVFSDSAANAEFRLSPTPATIAGSFAW